MTKEQLKVVDIKEEYQDLKTDYIKLIREATQAHGASTFVRVNLDEEVSVEGLRILNEVYSKEGVEVFSNGKSVLLLKS